MVNRTLPQSPGAKLIGGAVVALVALAGFLFVSLGGGLHSLAGSPRLVIGPNPASPGSTVTVTGFDYPSSRGVEIYFQSPSQGLVKAMTNAGGFFNASFKLPRSLGAASRIYAVSGGAVANVVVQVMKPSLFASVAASSFAVSGRGFVAGEPVALTLEGKSSRMSEGTVMANSLGGFTFQTTLSAKEMQDTLIATDLAKDTAIIPLVDPDLNVAPPQGPRGTRVTFTGGGYVPGEIVTITFQDNLGNITTVARTRAFRNGRISGRFIVPISAAPGQATVTATGSAFGSITQALYTVVVKLDVDPKAGVPGTVVTAVGGSFFPFEDVQINLICQNASCASIPLETTTALFDGTINTSFSIPSGTPPGAYSIVFVGQSSGITFTVTFHVIL